MMHLSSFVRCGCNSHASPSMFEYLSIDSMVYKFPQICQPVCFNVFQGVRNVEMKGFSAYSSNLELQAILK